MVFGDLRLNLRLNLHIIPMASYEHVCLRPMDYAKFYLRICTSYMLLKWTYILLFCSLINTHDPFSTHGNI
jgi:hypothetical protein